MEKKCTKCGETKVLTEFVKHKSYKDGHYSQCKVCTRQLEKNWRQENPDKKNEIRTRYRVNNREKIREMDRSYYINNHEKYLEKAKEAQLKYYNTEKGKEKYKQQSKLIRQRFPEKVRARSLLSTAICEGKIQKPSSCSLCSATEYMIEAHHPDYSKPYDVIWMCRPCHNLLHRKIKSRRERLNPETPKGDVIVPSTEETCREKSEAVSPPS